MKMLFLAPSRDSRGEAAIAADLARQLPRKRIQVGFVSTAESMPQLHDLGMPTLPLTGDTPAANLAILDKVMSGFQPDLLVATDAFAVNESGDWSGLSVQVLRERYDCRIGSIDRLGWQAADYAADCYGGTQVSMPRLLDGCDVLIRTCPPHAPVAGWTSGPGQPFVVQTSLHPGGLREGGLRPVTLDDGAPSGTDRPAAAVKRPVVLIVNSEWEYRNRSQSAAVARLIDALPQILHSHLAAIGRPLQVIHVGPQAWQFPLADQLEYRHFSKMPYPMFHARLASADLFLTTNTLSTTLGRAVLAGVPALVLQNSSTLDEQATPGWLRQAAPQLGTAYPFRVAPLGWHDLLEPLLSNNPYRDCFATAEIFDRDAVQQQLAGLLGAGPERTRLRTGQQSFRELLTGLAKPVDVLREVLVR